MRAWTEALESGTASEETRARAIVLLQILSRDSVDSAIMQLGEAIAWRTLLVSSERPGPQSTDRPAVRLLQAARALDRGDAAAAHAWLDGVRAPRELRVLYLHLQARIAQHAGSADRAVQLQKQIVDARPTPSDLELIAEAGLALARSALERGEDPEPWLDRIPDRSVLAPRAQLVRLLVDLPALGSDQADARLAAWITANPHHSAVDEARAWRVGLALDARDFGKARELALERAYSLDAERERLEAARTDPELLEVWAGQWFGADATAVARVDAARWQRALGELTSRLTTRDAKWPRVHEAVHLAPLQAQADDTLRLEISTVDRERDAALADSIGRASHQLELARDARDRLANELDRRMAYHERGASALDDVEARLRSALAELRALQELAPGLLAELRAVEDTLLDRIERRSHSLLDRARRIEQNAAGLHWLYAEGPMVRRDPRPRKDVPVPGALLRGEEELARAVHGTLDSLRSHSHDLVRRSFSEVFAYRVTEGADQAEARTRWLLERGSGLYATLDSTRSGLHGDARLAAARSAVNEAEERVASSYTSRHEHRLEATRRALALAIDALHARREGLLYTLAVATTQLALDPDQAAHHGGSTALGSDARDLWAAFLALDPHPRVRGDARYRSADLELVLARAEFQQRMGDWLQEAGGDQRSLAPLLDIEPALALFRSILDEDPGFAHRDLVLFQLGMLLADRGDGAADHYLATLVREHPGSPVLQEAHLRRGELAFDAEDHRSAIGHLSTAAAGEDAQASAIALYKLGWSANTVGDTRLAIDSFLRLADLYADSTRAPRRIDLEQESRALLLRSIARDGGAESFARTFDSAGERSFAPRLLADLSGILTGYALDDQAAQADRLFLHRYPLDAGALDAAERMVLGAERAGGVAGGDAARLEVFEHFAHGGDWAAAQPADSLRARGDEFARGALLIVAVRHHQRAREEQDAQDYATALVHYDQLLARWPAFEEAGRWSLLAGECARSAGDPAAALERFARAASAGGELGTEAAWQLVATADAWYADSIADGAVAGTDSLARRLLRVGDAHPPTDAVRAADLRWRLASVALAHAWDDEVAARFAAFAAEHPDDPRSLRAMTLHAESVYRAEDYDEAARIFDAATARAAASGADSLATALRPWIAHSEDLHAASIAADPERGPAQAAPLWRSLVARWPDFEEADRALYQAGLGFEQAGAHAEAVEAWNTLLDHFGQSSYAADTHRNLARNHEQRGDLTAAAAAIELYARTFPGAPDAGPSLLHAVDLRERAGDHSGRAQTLDLYLDQQPEDLSTRRWVLEERALTELDAGFEGEQVSAFLAFAARHPEHASPALSARIELRRADRLLASYEEIALTQPLPAALEHKRDALTRVLHAYREVVERGASPFAQAAAFRIGSALVHMGDALLASERPASLSGDDLLAYDEVLQAQAWGFSERGEEAWRELLRHQRPGQDPELEPWIASTRAALFPRTAQRFLHSPSFEYPVLNGSSSGR